MVTDTEKKEIERFIDGIIVLLEEEELSPQQMEFVEIFVKNEGKITHMEGELGLSYPTIRNRLHEIIRAMGYEPGKDGGGKLTEEDRRKILEDLNEGKITSEIAMQLLQEG